MSRRRSRLDPDDIELIAARVAEVLRSAPEEVSTWDTISLEPMDLGSTGIDGEFSSERAMARSDIEASKRRRREKPIATRPTKRSKIRAAR